MNKSDIYYMKDKKAQLYKKQEVGKIENGISVSGGYRPAAESPIWCYTSQLSQNDIYNAAAHGEKEERFFVFNYRPNIELYDLVLYKDTWYRIIRVDRKDDYNGDTFVYVTLAKGTWKPSADEVLPYAAQENN